MLDEKDHEVEDLPDSKPDSPRPAHPRPKPHDGPPVEKTCRILKNCGDCEPGGFGSTYGFGPR
jgi:hypothetical protein